MELLPPKRFFFARISPRIDIDTPNIRAEVTFAIAESTACIVDTTIVTAIESITPPDTNQRLTPVESAHIQAIVSPLQNLRYSKTALLDSLSAVVNYLHNNGYLFARIARNPHVGLNTSHTSVHIIDTVETGVKYYFGNIEIDYDSSSGDACFAENAVLKELEFNTGDVFSEAKRVKSEENF